MSDVQITELPCSSFQKMLPGSMDRTTLNLSPLPVRTFSSLQPLSTAFLLPPALWASQNLLIPIVAVKNIVQLLSCPNLC